MEPSKAQIHGSLRRRAVVVVAHPDDETLWCGGYILAHPEFAWRIVTLCRASDADRAPKFYKMLECYGAEGAMADLDDGPEQRPLLATLVEETIAELLQGTSYDLVLTHGPKGEYTQHRRHEECSQAVTELWRRGALNAQEVWLFAYEDGARAYLPRARMDADRRVVLTAMQWSKKKRIIMGIYGYGPESWEARTTPREEGFSCVRMQQALPNRGTTESDQ